MFLKWITAGLILFVLSAVLDLTFKYLFKLLKIIFKLIMAPFIIAGLDDVAEEQENGQAELDHFFD